MELHDHPSGNSRQYWENTPNGKISYLTLQRYLMKYLVKAPFPVREIGTVMTLLHACHVP